MLSKPNPPIRCVLALALSVIISMPANAQTPAKNTQVKHNPSYVNLGKNKAYEGKLNSLSEVNIRNAKLELITDQLDRPWALEFLDDERIIITEIGGGIKVLNQANKTITTLQNVPPIFTNDHQIGLLDVEIDPNFKHNKTIYFSYSKPDPESRNYFSLAVASATLQGDRLENLKTIFDANPFTWSPSNFGGALEFDDKGYLYIATGDRSESKSAQKTNILQGKILRVKTDGSAAPNNPFEHLPGIDNRIFATGVRNPQGLHFDGLSGRLFEAEHGPMGGDEINIIQAGANYGWPVVTYGMSYTTETIGEGTHHEAMTQPIFYYLPSEAISPLTVYRGDMFPEWDGDILVGALKGKHISKLDFDGGLIRSEYPILTEIKDRVRDIKVAADGSIYVLHQKGTLNRLYRDSTPSAPVVDNTDGATIYKMACSGCHDIGAYQSPILGNAAQWQKVLQQPIELTYKHTLEGINAMPARGYCNICNDEQLKITVDYMLEQARPPQNQ